jgi:methylglyoxal synthase
MSLDPKAPMIALVAHDQRKDALVEWAVDWADLLAHFRIVATGTTGGRVADAARGLDVTRVKSGPLGGDQQIGALIAEDEVDALVFFVDPLSPHPHDVDVKALIRMATLADIPLACNRATADAVMEHFARTLAP